MKSEVDTSILNSVNIKRFTKTVLDEYGAEIDTSNRAKWNVTFPDELASRLDRQEGILVFDSADREMGAGDLLVQPGTQVFSAILDLVQQSESVGRLKLTEDTLQINPPRVLQESDISIASTDFTNSSSDFALTFHFRVQFETPASFHSEEMYSVTIDLDTLTRLPDLTERLTSHLPQLLEKNNHSSPNQISDPAVENAYEEAQEAIVDRSRPIVSDLQKEAEETVDERVQEITDYYDKRRSELDNQISEQKQKIRKWKRKRQKARKDSTRRKYIKNRKEAERDLQTLKEDVQEKKKELDKEESEEIDEIIDRYEIDVEVSLLGVTEVTYVRGTLALDLKTDHTETVEQVSYLPATDEYHGLDCAVCSRDLTEGILPQLCLNGHLVGDSCSTTCRTCGLTYCDDCEVESEFEECEICWEDTCESCIETCELCHSSICGDHVNKCSECGAKTGDLCGEDCSTCGEFHCDWHLTQCPDCGEYHCDSHIESCSICDSDRCVNDINQCVECGELFCSEHSETCETCGEPFCEQHLKACEKCSVDEVPIPNVFCDHDAVSCSVGGEILCSEHRRQRNLGSGYVCDDHSETCGSCKIEYMESEIAEGRCPACQRLGDVEKREIPSDIVEEFRSVDAGENSAYMVILGKKLFGRNKVVVYDKQAGEEVRRHSAGMLKQLLGGYK